MWPFSSKPLPGAIVLEKGSIQKEIARHEERLKHLAARIEQIGKEKATVVEHLEKQIADHEAEHTDVEKRKSALETLVGAL